MKIWLTGKDPNAGRDWGQERGVTEDETVGWHHWFNGHEFEQDLRDSEGQGSLECYNPRGSKESGMTLVTEQQQNIQLLLHLVLKWRHSNMQQPWRENLLLDLLTGNMSVAKMVLSKEFSTVVVWLFFGLAGLTPDLNPVYDALPLYNYEGFLSQVREVTQYCPRTQERKWSHSVMSDSLQPHGL